MQEEDYVYYAPFPGCPTSEYQKGRIKEVQSEEWFFVVYNCNNDWDDFRNYTGQRTHISQLIEI